MADPLNGFPTTSYGNKDFRFVRWNPATQQYESGLTSPTVEGVTREILRSGAATAPGGTPQTKMRELFSTPSLWAGKPVTFTDDPETFLRLQLGRAPTQAEIDALKAEALVGGLTAQLPYKDGTLGNLIYIAKDRYAGQPDGVYVQGLVGIVLHELRHTIVPNHGHDSPYDPKTKKIDPGCGREHVRRRRPEHRVVVVL